MSLGWEAAGEFRSMASQSLLFPPSWAGRLRQWRFCGNTALHLSLAPTLLSLFLPFYVLICLPTTFLLVYGYACLPTISMLFPCKHDSTCTVTGDISPFHVFTHCAFIVLLTVVFPYMPFVAFCLCLFVFSYGGVVGT